MIGEAENGQEALDLCRKLAPEVVLMDVHMPVMGGVEATQRIHKELPGVRVVMLTMSVDEDDLFEAIKAGAQGYVLKDVHARQLHNALRGVIQGDATLSGPVAARVLAEFSQMKQPAQENLPEEEKLEALTERELSRPAIRGRRADECGDRREAFPERANDQERAEQHHAEAALEQPGAGGGPCAAKRAGEIGLYFPCIPDTS